MFQILSDRTALSEAGADYVIQVARESLAERGRFVIALAGGSTPRDTYRRLADPSILQELPWQDVHVFWSDERCVGLLDERSNYGMAYRIWLRQLPALRRNLYEVPVELPPDKAAARYESTIRRIVPDGRFDLILLGLGDDGHTASIFPGTPAVSEQQRWVVGLDPNRRDASYQRVEPAVARITFTPPLINRARNVLFLVAGRGKAHAVGRARQPNPDPNQVPTARIQPHDGKVVWMVEQTASDML